MPFCRNLAIFGVHIYGFFDEVLDVQDLVEPELGVTLQDGGHDTKQFDDNLPVDWILETIQQVLHQVGKRQVLAAMAIRNST